MLGILSSGFERNRLRKTHVLGKAAASRIALRLMYTKKRTVGTWLSLVERTLGVGEVAGSNPVVPTIETP